MQFDVAVNSPAAAAIPFWLVVLQHKAGIITRKRSVASGARDDGNL